MTEVTSSIELFKSILEDMKSDSIDEAIVDSIDDILENNEPETLKLIYGSFLNENSRNIKEVLGMLLIKYMVTPELVIFLRKEADWTDLDFEELDIDFRKYTD